MSNCEWTPHTHWRPGPRDAEAPTPGRAQPVQRHTARPSSERLFALEADERSAVVGAPWFRQFSALLRHDVLRHAVVRRYGDGDAIATQGRTAEDWMCCCAGSVRISTAFASGRQSTLAYLQPGMWFGESSLIAGGTCTHDAHARGRTSVLCVSAAHFAWLLEEHKEFSVALLRVHAKRVRCLYGQLEDTQSLSLRMRVTKQLVQLARSHGVADGACGREVRITLRLAQAELAQMVGASRQRLNWELKILERERAIFSRSRQWVVRPQVLADILAASP